MEGFEGWREETRAEGGALRGCPTANSRCGQECSRTDVLDITSVEHRPRPSQFRKPPVHTHAPVTFEYALFIAHSSDGEYDGVGVGVGVTVSLSEQDTDDVSLSDGVTAAVVLPVVVDDLDGDRDAGRDRDLGWVDDCVGV